MGMVMSMGTSTTITPLHRTMDPDLCLWDPWDLCLGDLLPSHWVLLLWWGDLWGVLL